MVQLTDELVDLLDERAARNGVSRSQLIREAVEELLASDRERRVDRQIVEGYSKMPQGGEYDVDEWGTLAQQMTELTADQMRRLTEEEREAGFEPW
jgi:metal-responsive CopG/Arc/MetJ family transcriptional regulator